MHPQLALAIETIHKQSANITVSELRKSLGISSSRFCQLFRREIGIPPVRYIRNTRLAAAKDMLESGDHTLKEVVFNCGFRDRSHFSREFKKLYGRAPSHVRGDNHSGKGDEESRL